MKIRLSELKRIITREVALASAGGARGYVAPLGEDDDMCEADEQTSDTAQTRRGSRRRRPTPRMPKRGRHNVTSRKGRNVGGQRRPVKAESRARAGHLEQQLIDCLDMLDRCDDDAYRFPNGRSGPDEPSCSGDRAYGIEVEIEDIISMLENAGYSEEQILAIDPRVSNHLDVDDM